MKKILLVLISLFFAVFTYAQTTATDFKVSDCNGVSHDLFSELDEGKVIVLIWVMPCASCLKVSLEAYTAVQEYAKTNPGEVMYFMADDLADTHCSTLSTWANTNGMTEINSFFSDTKISMSDYGSFGMPKVVVLATKEHIVYYNENYKATNIKTGIDEALVDVKANSVNENLTENTKFNLSPNPVNKSATLSFNLYQESLIQIDIVNIMGQNIRNISKSFVGKDSGSVEFSTETLSAGIYFLKIKTDQENRTVLFSVSH